MAIVGIWNILSKYLIIYSIFFLKMYIVTKKSFFLWDVRSEIIEWKHTSICPHAMNCLRGTDVDKKSFMSYI